MKFETNVDDFNKEIQAIARIKKRNNLIVAGQRRRADMTIKEKREQRNKLRKRNGHLTFEKSMFYLGYISMLEQATLTTL